MRLGGNNLELYHFAKQAVIEDTTVCISLSHTHALYTLTLYTKNDNNKKNTLHNCVCPSYIYTYITFRLFTNIA